MKMAGFLCCFTALGIGSVAARDFPLTYKTLKPEEAMRLPGASGAYGQLQVAKPSGLKKEPKAASGHPLYGQMQDGPVAKGMIFRLDESRGEGKGYDELILDMNQNGDLTDDIPAKPSENTKPKSEAGGYETSLFGPIQAPNTLTVGNWKPLYCAQMFVFNRAFSSMGNSPGMNNYIGQLSLRACCYLEAEVEVDGIKCQIGIVDGNANLKLGDPSKGQVYKNPDGDNMYFNQGDSIIRNPGNLSELRDPMGNDADSFSSIIYFTSHPQTIKLAADFKTISIEPFQEALSVLEIQPAGSQVSVLSLGYERSVGQWEMLKPVVKDGKAKVPPGNYRLYSCTITGKNAKGETVTAMGYKREIKDTIKVAAGEAVVLKCGGPLAIRATANKQNAARSGGGLMNAAINLFSRNASATQPTVDINMTVAGVGSETYSTYTKGKGQVEMPKPTFVVLDADGKQVGNGTLEFG